MNQETSPVSYDTEKNLLHDIYQEYQKSTYMQTLNDKYTLRPYYVQYKYTRCVALVSSFVFNIFSGLTAMVLVYFFAQEIIGVEEISIAITLVFLILFEVVKRLLTSHLWKDYLQSTKVNVLGVVSLVILFSMSMGGSYFGSKELVNNFSNELVVIEPPVIIESMDKKIEDYNQKVLTAQNTTYRDGRTTIESRETIKVLAALIAALELDKIALEKGYLENVAKVKNERSNEMRMKAYWFALFTLFFEVCFMISVWYLEYFDWRSWKEFEGVHNLYTSGKQRVYNANAKAFSGLKPESDSIVEDEKYLKSRIATAKYRIKKGIGNEETNRHNLEKFEEILSGVLVNQRG